MNYPDKKPVKKDVMKKAEEAVRQFRRIDTPDSADSDNYGVRSDILGSYTGLFYDGGIPDQDADDL